MKALDVMKKKRLEQGREVREKEGHLQRARDHRNKAEEVQWAPGPGGCSVLASMRGSRVTHRLESRS